MTSDLTKGKYVSRSVYQKKCEENKKLLADIKILTADGISPEKVILITKWREVFKKRREFNELLTEACRQYLEEHPEYKIPAKTDSNPKAFK